MSDLDFPAGSMLVVVREAGFDRHGDPVGQPTEHEIGPCSIQKTWAGRKTDNTQERLTNRISVTSQNPDDDVIATDKVRLPSGLVVDVSSVPLRPTNPWTGWTPVLRFTLEEVV